MSDDGEPFQGNLFPSSYVVLYCPFRTCDLDQPFKDAAKLLVHLEEAHGTRIESVNAVLPFLDRYLEAVAGSGLLSSNENGSLVIGAADAADTEIRDRLQKQKLAEMLDIQEKERCSLYKRSRQCLFCPDYTSSLKGLFSHMFSEHHFNIGLLDNLVMVEDFLRVLQTQLDQNVCIFCHNVFRTAGCLRRHMKNKRHYKIDPKNHHFDRYYIVNYIKCGTLGADAEKDEELEARSGEPENDWADLEMAVDHRSTCLFCEEVFEAPNAELTAHMKAAHHFDLAAIRSGDNMYDYIKAVTFLRNRMRELTCPFCHKAHGSQQSFGAHLATERHCRLPDRQVWDRPEFLFPLFDDDPLLFDFGEDE